MKREKFLWPLTHGHHYGLMAAKAIQRKLGEKPTKEQLKDLRQKAESFFEADLKSHFGVEERILDQLAYHTSPADLLLERTQREHWEMRELLRKGDARSLELFAEKLIQHIYFEEDRLFPEIEDQFTSAEKEWVETDIRFNIQGWPRVSVFAEK